MTLKQCQNNIDYLLNLKKFTYLRINCRIEKKKQFLILFKNNYSHVDNEMIVYELNLYFLLKYYIYVIYKILFL